MTPEQISEFRKVAAQLLDGCLYHRDANTNCVVDAVATERRMDAGADAIEALLDYLK